MEKKSNVKIRFCRSSTLLKVVVLAVLVLSVVTLLTLRAGILDARAETEAMRGEAALQVQENERLEEKIEDLGTVQGIINVAQEQLGLVEPGTVVLEP